MIESDRPEVSVAICTFNSADRITLVLEALARQTETSARWEVVVVDNASRDETRSVVLAGLARYLPTRGRMVHEPQPGLMYARQKATAEVRGRFIAFLDDDNIPYPDYLEKLLAVLDRHPNVGVVGGKVEPEWLGEPTALGQAVANFALAICDRGEQPFSYPDITGGPAGAGMVLQRALLEKIFEEQSLANRVTGRTGTALVGGEDTALVIRAHQLGYDCRYEPSLVIKHRIPAARTQPAYLRRLYEGIGRGQASMRQLYDAKARSTVLAVLIAVKEGMRWLAGGLCGPSAQTKKEFGPLAAEVHRLQQRQVYGRFHQGLREPFRR